MTFFKYFSPVWFVQIIQRIIPPHAIEDEDLRRLFESATLLPIKERILEQAFERKTYALDDYIDDLPVNLYGFNKCTHLLDWVLATARGTSTILDCEGMLFTKLVDLSWASLDQTTATALSQTLSQLFQNLKCLLQKPDFIEKFQNEINAYAIEMIKQTDLFDVSLFFTVYSFTMIAIRPFAGKLVDRKGLRFVLYPSIAIFSASFLLLGNADVLWMVLLAAMLKALGQGAGVPGIQSTCLQQLGREKAGVVSSTCYIGQDIGNAIAPPIGGAIASAFGYCVMFSSYAVLILIGASAIFYFKSNYDRKKYNV